MEYTKNNIANFERNLKWVKQNQKKLIEIYMT